jgi:polysaccharide export outer membrane protein
MKKLASLWSFVFFALAATHLLSGCGMDAAQTNKPVTAAAEGQTPMASQTGQPVVASHTNSQAIAAVPEASAAATEYRISQQDILQISVFQVNDLNSAVQVNQDGSITLPLIGKAQVAGRTTSEAEQIIAGKLRQKYLQSPQVSVSVKTFGKRITVGGAVTQPKVLADDANTTLSQAIANAGGVAEIGNSERVHVARSKDQHVQDDVYNLDDIQAGKIPDPLLKGGDIVVVEQSGVKVAYKSISALLPFALLATVF